MTITEENLRLGDLKLDKRAEIALLARILHGEGYNDHFIGHITYRDDDDTFLTLPFHLAWDEVRASDIQRIDGDGNVLGSDVEINPGIMLHLALHRARPNCGVAIHNHPRYATIYAAARRVPEAYDQLSSFFRIEDVAMYNEYEGTVISEETSMKNVEAIGQKNIALLANHGVMILGDSIGEAHFRAMTFEWRCKQAWHVEAIGGGTPVPIKGQDALIMAKASSDKWIYWDWAVRREIRKDPSILD